MYDIHESTGSAAAFGGRCPCGPGSWFGVVELFGRLDLAAQSQPTPLSYTVEQASEGRSAYLEHCATCHGENVDDGEFAPPLKGVDFRRKWRSSSPEALFTLTSDTMPQDRPGVLGDETYAQLLAYILQENGSEPGTAELPADAEALQAMASPDWSRPGGGGLAPGVILPPAPSRLNPLDRIRPVTDAMLTHVPDGEWLTWRRTYDAFGFSPLTEINRTNVSELRVAWSWALPNGPNEATPLAHDGVLFVPQLWRHGSGTRCDDRRSAVAVLPPAALGRGTQRQTEHLDPRQSSLRTDIGRACRRPRCQDRERRLGRKRSVTRRPASV